MPSPHGRQEKRYTAYATGPSRIRLVAVTSDVILPAGGLPMLLLARECPFVIDGALVLDGIVVVATAAEMALSLHRLTGSVVSRRGTCAEASTE